MSDPESKPAANPPAAADSPAEAVTGATPAGSTIHIADEFGTAKRNLPPAKILVFATVGILILVGIASFFQRAKPQGTGSLDNVAAVDLPGQNSVLVALTFTLQNSGKKPMWVYKIEGKVTTATGESVGEAVSAVDFDRYYQAFPALKENTQPPLAPEDKLQPGEAVRRTIMVSFPLNLDNFMQRKSVSVVIHPYDQPVPVTLSR